MNRSRAVVKVPFSHALTSPIPFAAFASLGGAARPRSSHRDEMPPPTPVDLERLEAAEAKRERKRARRNGGTP